MLIKSRGASCAFKLFIAIVGTMALVNSIGLFKLTFHGNFFLYFTNISNLATVLYYWCNIVQIHKIESSDRSRGFQSSSTPLCLALR